MKELTLSQLNTMLRLADDADYHANGPLTRSHLVREIVADQIIGNAEKDRVCAQFTGETPYRNPWQYSDTGTKFREVSGFEYWSSEGWVGLDGEPVKGSLADVGTLPATSLRALILRGALTIVGDGCYPGVIVFGINFIPDSLL